MVQPRSCLLRKFLQLLLSVVVATEEGRVAGFHISLDRVAPDYKIEASNLILIAFHYFLKIKHSECVLKKGDLAFVVGGSISGH